MVRTVTGTNRLIRNHRHRRFDGTVTHFRAARDHQGSDLNPAMWQPYAARLEVIDLPMLHAEMTSAEASSLIAPELNRRMAQG